MLEQNIDNWDKLTSIAARKDGYIITGNLLKALVSTREQGVGGKLISYTTDTGEVRQGILMPDNFEPAGLTSKTPISSKKEELRWRGDKITSADGEVTIKRDYGNWYILTVPKSKKKGEKYFNDDVLLSLVNNNSFEGSTRLSADIIGDNIDAVLKRLDELGVTVAEEHKEDNNSQSSLSRNAETEESQNKDVPLERRVMKSYTDKDGVYHEGIEEELERIESSISGASDETAADMGGGAEVLEHRPSARELNELRKQAAKLRAEKARRSQKKQEIRDRYNINETLRDWYLSREIDDVRSSMADVQ